MITVTLSVAEWSSVVVALHWADMISDPVAKATVAHCKDAIQRIVAKSQIHERVPLAFEPDALALIHWVCEQKLKSMTQHPTLSRIATVMRAAIE